MNLGPAEDFMGNSSFFFQRFGLAANFERFFFFSDLILTLNIVVYCFSSVSNTIIILVLLKDGFKLTSNISFFALAIADLLVSIIWLPRLMSLHDVLYLYVNGNVRWIANALLFPCVEAINTIGSWITAVITVERMCCIMFPLKVTFYLKRCKLVQQVSK